MKNNKLLRFISSIFIAFVLFFSISQKVKAVCSVQNSGGPDAPQGEVCTTFQGNAIGRSEFSCANYPDGFGGSFYGCYWNQYICDSPCGSSATPGGGGGGQCARPATINCPAGWTRGTVRHTLYTCPQSRPAYCPALGSAQRYETARHPTASNRFFLYGCGSCYVDESLWNEPFTHCDWYRIGVYNCVPICTSVAPSAPNLLSPSDTSSSATENINLEWDITGQTWGTGCPSNNNQYLVYVGTTPSSLALVGTVNSSTNTISFNGTPGQTYYWRVTSSNGSLTANSSVWSFAITQGPWWQVTDGDVTTNGNITSLVPSGSLFNIAGLGGFPGVPVYGSTFSLYPTYTDRISSNTWHSNTTTQMPRIFNYSYFENLIPEDIVFNDISDLESGGVLIEGYEWFKTVGNYEVSNDIDLAGRKVILFVENGDLILSGRINLTDGVGFFGAFVNGDIAVNPAVTGTPTIEGVYLSDGVFSSGPGSSQLHIRGSVASYGGTLLERDLGSNITPAEMFEFAPDQMLLFPERLMFRRSKWTEVAP